MGSGCDGAFGGLYELGYGSNRRQAYSVCLQQDDAAVGCLHTFRKRPLGSADHLQRESYRWSVGHNQILRPWECAISADLPRRHWGFWFLCSCCRSHRVAPLYFFRIAHNALGRLYHRLTVYVAERTIRAGLQFRDRKSGELQRSGGAIFHGWKACLACVEYLVSLMGAGVDALFILPTGRV